MITADQLICHAIGDYVLQSDWMANEKTKRSIAALWHVATYGLPFLFLRPSPAAYLFIVATHFIIDRWRLARYVAWAKNFWLSPYTATVDGGDSVGQILKKSWEECKATGYPPDRPAWLAVWLMIITDNLMHVLCNGLALAYL